MPDNETHPRKKRFVLAILAAALFVAACWTANLTVYHYFAADFPADPTREWHKMWGNRFLGLTSALFAGFAYALMQFRRIGRRSA